jgi:hypothetical protein
MLLLRVPPLNCPNESLHCPAGFFGPVNSHIHFRTASAEQTGDIL